jgi:hypothetical protein
MINIFIREINCEYDSYIRLSTYMANLIKLYDMEPEVKSGCQGNAIAHKLFSERKTLNIIKHYRRTGHKNK